MVKFISLFLKFLHALAEREEQKQFERQRKYRRQQEEKAKVLFAEECRLRSRAEEVRKEYLTCDTAAALGSSEINEAQRQACTLRYQLQAFKGE